MCFSLLGAVWQPSFIKARLAGAPSIRAGKAPLSAVIAVEDETNCLRFISRRPPYKHRSFSNLQASARCHDQHSKPANLPKSLREQLQTELACSLSEIGGVEKGILER